MALWRIQIEREDGSIENTGLMSWEKYVKLRKSLKQDPRVVKLVVEDEGCFRQFTHRSKEVMNVSAR